MAKSVQQDKRGAPALSRLLFRVARNWFSLIGIVLCITGAIVFLFLLGVDMIAEAPHAYVGVLLLFMPPFILFGLVLMGVGRWYQRKAERAGRAPGQAYGGFDIERRGVQQQVLLLLGGLTAVSVFLLSVGSIKAYEFTESNTFCGQVCHAVMTPEFTAYQHSAHARVACVDCHVGEGASFWVRSKISGLYQVYAYSAGEYPTPIPTPIESLRPAQDTCEQCHWPRFFFGARQSTYTHFLSEGGADPWVIEMLLKIGGGQPEGRSSGIHWHMNIANVVEYVARDETRQDIAWVRLTDSLGNETLYTDLEEPPSDELLASAEVRRMDCMDCHNRPTHVFRAPVELVNEQLDLGNIDPSLPDIKLLAVEALARPYESMQAADEAITNGVRQAYYDDYPEFYADNRALVDEAIVALKRVYRANFFPEMKVRWDSYPDNIGHWFFPGCMRCHDGSLASSDGRTVSTRCETCHTFLYQGYASERDGGGGTNGGPFVHPYDGEVMDEPILCTDCHDGALDLF